MSCNSIPAEFLPKYEGRPAIVIGNAPNRSGIDINELRGRAVVFGCNRLFEDVDFKGYPFFLGCCDESIYEMIGPQYEWRRNHNVVCYHEPPHPVMDHFKVNHINYPRALKWEDTGTAMIQLADFLGCRPIYLLGFLGIENRHHVGEIEVAVDNMYSHDITKKGKREQTNFHIAWGTIREFWKNIQEFNEKKPGVLVDVQAKEYSSKPMPADVPVISYSEMLNTLQSKFTSKATVIGGLTIHV